MDFCDDFFFFVTTMFDLLSGIDSILAILFLQRIIIFLFCQ